MLTFDKNNKNMKIKILRGDRGKWYHNTDNVGREFCVIGYYENSPLRFAVGDGGGYWVDKDDCVITELPESFCVKRCDDNNRDDWNKYLQWLNKQKNYPIPMFGGVDRYKYYGVNGENLHSDYLYPFGTEIHLDDMIKHIDFYSEPMECKRTMKERYEDTTIDLLKDEFDLTTDKGILAYAKKHYPIGTKYIPINNNGELVYRYSREIAESIYNPIWFRPSDNSKGIICGNGFIYGNGKWAKIVKESQLPILQFYKEPQFTVNMETQRLYRHGLKEIHSVACTNWKEILEKYGANNPLEDYIELTQAQVDTMFNSCTKGQLPIVSKYLKQDDGSVDVTKFTLSGKGFCDDNFYIIRDREWGEYKKQSFLLSERYDWEIKTDDVGQLCLIPTKKK